MALLYCWSEAQFNWGGCATELMALLYCWSEAQFNCGGCLCHRTDGFTLLLVWSPVQLGWLCFLRYRISAGTWNLTSGKSHLYLLAAAATRGFTMVLLTEPSKHLCRRYMRSIECHSSSGVPVDPGCFQENEFVVVYSLVHSIHWLNASFIHSLIHSFLHSLTYS